ncbi:MAG: hypothetical protein ACKVPX_05370 [Myxococcaceae bacterium]
MLRSLLRSPSSSSFSQTLRGSDEGKLLGLQRHRGGRDASAHLRRKRAEHRERAGRLTDGEIVSLNHRESPVKARVQGGTWEGPCEPGDAEAARKAAQVESDSMKSILLLLAAVASGRNDVDVAFERSITREGNSRQLRRSCLPVSRRRAGT